MVDDRWISVDEIAYYIGIIRDTIYVWLRKGKMSRHHSDHPREFERFQVDKWPRAGGATRQREPDRLKVTVTGP